MASTTNKVRYGLSRVHYTIFDEDTKEYGEIKPLAGAVNLSFDAQGSQNQFYADNVIYFTSNPNGSDTGTLELADMTDSARIDLLGYVRDEATGVLYEPTTVHYPTFALLYQVEGDGNTLRGIRYNVTMSRPSESFATTSDSVDPNTQSFEYTATGRDFEVDGETVNVLKAHVTDSGDDHAAFDAWFTKVVTPGTAVDAVAADDATLSALTVGSLALTPAFAADTTLYRVTTTNESDAVTATASDSEATVAITAGGSAISSGDSVTWDAGLNEVKVTVTSGEASAEYTILVTKS